MYAISVLAFLAAATVAVPAPQTSTPPPPGESYVTGYPICNVSGFTMIPGDYVETIYQQSGSTLTSCIEACRNDPTCESIAYAAIYTECLFFDKVTEEVQLYEDESSYFNHFDEECCAEEY